VPSPACSSGASCSPSTSTYQQPPALDAAELPVLHGAVEQPRLGRAQPVQLSIRLERMALTDRHACLCCNPCRHFLRWNRGPSCSKTLTVMRVPYCVCLSLLA
jgi:hypothetical protein